MDTFIYKVMNATCRNHDYPKIEKIGPLGQALKYILKGAEFARPLDHETLPRD